MTPSKPRALITGASVAGPATAFWLERLGWDVVVVEKAPAFREEGQNVDVRGPGHEALSRMGLLDAVKAENTGEQAWTFVNADNDIVARFDQEAFGANGPTADLEVLRGDLARILHDACGPGVEWRYGDHVAALADREADVEVTFASGRCERFDLVVIAEGAGASTRKLVFGHEPEIEPLGLDMGYFTIPKGATDGDDARWFNAPGGRSVFLRPDPHGTTRAVLTIQQSPIGWDDLSTDEQKAKLIEAFADAGWETPRVLDGLKAADDFYFHSITQVQTPRHVQGRVCLMGDAGWAVMGRGTTLALIGAYVLAGELARTPDVRSALEAFDEAIKPYVEKAQKVPSWGPKVLQPQTELGIALQHAGLALFAAPGVRKLTAKMIGTGDDLPDLPNIPELFAT